MSSVFDDPREVLEPPTWAEWDEKLGAPVLSFRVGDGDVRVPQGLLACCRVVHQPHCDHHVALTMLVASFEVRLPDGTAESRAALPQMHEGDALARPRDLLGAVESSRLMAVATAEARGGLLASMTFDIWTLNLEQAEIWRYLSVEREDAMERRLRASDEVPEELIARLRIAVLDPEDRAAVASAMGRPSFRHARAYAHRVLMLPFEIGHDDDARYVTGSVWGTPDDVSPAAEAILRDPRETTGVPG